MANFSKKIGLFFGAGAEKNYGLPLGNKFAVDIFRPLENEKEFIKIISELYSDKKEIKGTVLTKSDYAILTESIIENKLDVIGDYFSHFDLKVNKLLEKTTQSQSNEGNLKSSFFIKRWKSYYDDNKELLENDVENDVSKKNYCECINSILRQISLIAIAYYIKSQNDEEKISNFLGTELSSLCDFDNINDYFKLNYASLNFLAKKSKLTIKIYWIFLLKTKKISLMN